ncbi:hypothetical protein [Halobacillus sp. Marseille-P3879]|uniref:hypothetical protein n=1 Tax=Halobacillus sp. Marseille-P3879 TaxID=2045014 RepID=UPI000C7D4765|nr:hypothetical protein [Halobacillus sp. Marseille-P3879]
MKIHLILFASSDTEQKSAAMVKSFDSDIRPVQGDIIDDPGFDAGFHNGYEVVKVTINYESEECLVSLSPLAIEVQEIKLETYVEKLLTHGWRELSNQEFAQ